MNQYTKEEIQFILTSLTTEEIEVSEMSNNDFEFTYDSQLFYINPKTGLLRSTDPTAQMLNRMIAGYQRAATKKFINIFKESVNAG